MATFKKFNKDKRPKRNTQSLLFKRKRFCRFTVAGVEEIDYKDVDTLRDFIGRSEEHTSELQSHSDLVCRLLLEKKKNKTHDMIVHCRRFMDQHKYNTERHSIFQ